MRRFLAARLLLLLVAYGDKAKDLYDTAQLEEKQNNKPHATKLYRQIVEEYPDSPYANQAKTRLTELEIARYILLQDDLYACHHSKTPQ
jgi:outer membrane protein assembly factor BamD (BamD/ComL family)